MVDYHTDLLVVVLLSMVVVADVVFVDVAFAVGDALGSANGCVFFSIVVLFLSFEIQ